MSIHVIGRLWLCEDVISMAAGAGVRREQLAEQGKAGRAAGRALCCLQVVSSQKPSDWGCYAHDVCLASQ